MRTIHVIYTSAMLTIGGMVLLGCKTNTEPTPGPTTMTVPDTNGKVAMPATMASPSASQTEVALPAVTPPAAKDLTHVLGADQPFFLNEPTGDPKPIATLKAGSKVLVLIPGETYSQVITDKGLKGYTPTAGLNPLGK